MKSLAFIVVALVSNFAFASVDLSLMLARDWDLALTKAIEIPGFKSKPGSDASFAIYLLNGEFERRAAESIKGTSEPACALHISYGYDDLRQMDKTGSFPALKISPQEFDLAVFSLSGGGRFGDVKVYAVTFIINRMSEILMGRGLPLTYMNGSPSESSIFAIECEGKDRTRDLILQDLVDSFEGSVEVINWGI